MLLGAAGIIGMMYSVQASSPKEFPALLLTSLCVFEHHLFLEGDTANISSHTHK